MSEPVKQKNPNALLLAFRKYHSWLGVAMTLCILIVALTGIYLNHKDLFKRWTAHKPRNITDHSSRNQFAGPSSSSENVTVLSTSTNLSLLPVTFDQALALSREQLGEQPVERIELKHEKGRLLYKIKSSSGEVLVDAHTREAVTREHDSPKIKGNEEPSILASQEKRHRSGIDWAKMLKDLHTGKIGGWAGKLVVDFTALILVILCLTGLYLWLIPLLRKRRSARQQARIASAKRQGQNLSSSQSVPEDQLMTTLS